MIALLQRKAIRVDDLYTPDDEARLRLIVAHAYTAMLKTMHLIVADALDLDPASFRLDDAATRAILDHAGTRVVGISETTRSALAELLQAGQARGDSLHEIATSIEHLFSVTWANRAETITRTEIGEAQRVSALDRYTASGLVDRVKLLDGDADEPCASRNGKTVRIGDAPGLAHPNCTLVLIPVLAGN